MNCDTHTVLINMTNNTQFQEDRYLDLKGLATYSSLGVGTIRDYLKQGLPAFKIKGKVLIRKSEFDEWIEGFRLGTKGILMLWLLMLLRS